MSIKARKQGESSFATDIRSLFEALRLRWFLIALCALLGCGIAFLCTRFMAKVYAARTVIQVEQEEQKVVKIEGVKSEDLKSSEILKTFEQNVTSPEVLLRVIHNKGIHDDPRFLPEVKGHSENALQAALARHIDARMRRGTRLIDITVEHQNPEMAQRIAELLVQEFVNWNFEAQRQAGQSANRFLLEEAARLKAKLARSEEALQSYKEQNEAVSLEDKQNITVEKLKELNLRVTMAKAERLKLEPDYSYLTSRGQHSPDDLLTIGGIANSPAVIELKKSISEKEAHLATLKERYKAEHPKFIEAESELQNLRRASNAAIRKAGDVLTSSYQAATVTEQKLDDAVREQQKLALELNKLSIPYAVLTRDAESDRALYDSVLTRLKETNITSGITQEPIRIVARPLFPDQPAGSRRTQALALGLLAGLAIGTFLAFLSDAVNRSFLTSRDAETRLDLRALAEIPKISVLRGAVERPDAVLTDATAMEAFRTLRTSLTLPRHDRAPRSYLFTSALQAEGKTFCAVNCAISFAQAGLKTLLVDADLRQPQMARMFFPAAAPAGVIQSTDIPNLFVTSATDGDPDAAGFVAGTNFEELMEQAMNGCERVVVDSAPVNLVSDTLLLARHVQSVCLVIKAAKTPADEVMRAAERLAEAGAPPIGFVWNQAKPSREYHYGPQPGREGSKVLRGWFGGERSKVAFQGSEGGTSPVRETSTEAPAASLPGGIFSSGK